MTYFQFHKGMDEKTGIVPGQELKGEWRPANGGAFLLWEDKDGQKWLVNGHHRWGLARQNKVQNVNSVVMREADGVSREQACLEGIQVNLREGTSTVKDTADFFRNSGMTEEEARQSGILSDTPSDRLSKPAAKPPVKTEAKPAAQPDSASWRPEAH